MQQSTLGHPGRESESMVKGMPAQDLFSTAQPEKGKLQGERAIVSAVIRYFEAAPRGPKLAKENTESPIIKALYRYFVQK